MLRFPAFLNLNRLLPPEDESIISSFEASIRRSLSHLYRFSLAIFLAFHLFDFLFNSVWLHGYIWSLNLPIELDMTDKSAGTIVYHQLTMVGLYERFLHSTFATVTTALFLAACGFSESRNVWYLFRISVTVGFTCGFVRTLQLKQRLFSSLHEGFYCYLVTFVIGVVLTIRIGETFPRADEKPVENKDSKDKVE